MHGRRDRVLVTYCSRWLFAAHRPVDLLPCICGTHAVTVMAPRVPAGARELTDAAAMVTLVMMPLIPRHRAPLESPPRTYPTIASLAASLPVPETIAAESWSQRWAVELAMLAGGAIAVVTVVVVRAAAQWWPL